MVSFWVAINMLIYAISCIHKTKMRYNFSTILCPAFFIADKTSHVKCLSNILIKLAPMICLKNTLSTWVFIMVYPF